MVEAFKLAARRGYAIHAPRVSLSCKMVQCSQIRIFRINYVVLHNLNKHLRNEGYREA